MCAHNKKIPCVSLIGMPGAGKSTVGAILADALGWAFMDSDKLIEALYATRLQDVTDFVGKDAFLDIEGAIIKSIRVSRCVIATGGSVIYRPEAMKHLASLGPIAYLQLSLEQARERIARNPERGIAIAPGQTLEDIYEERRRLYEKMATITCDTEKNDPKQCADFIISQLPRECRVQCGKII